MKNANYIETYSINGATEIHLRIKYTETLGLNYVIKFA